MITFKGKLQLNKQQKQWINHTLLQCVELYNLTLEVGLEQDALPSSFSLQEARQGFDIPSDIAQGQTTKACQSIIRHRIPDATGKYFGKPRFKQARIKTNSFNFTIRETQQRQIRQFGSVVRFHIPKLGEVKGRIGREITGQVKQIAIKVDSCGDYWFTICTTANKKDTLPEANTEAIGVDLGVKTTATCSNAEGTIVIQPEKKKFLDEKNLNALKHAQNKDKKALAFVHRKIARRRDDYNWKLARKIAASAERIYVGDVKPQWLIKGKLARHAADMALFDLKTKISSLAASAGRYYEVIDESYTSKTCSCCGEIKQNLTLSDRIYECSSCGFVLDRDLNAARNICKKGEQQRLGVSTSGKLPAV